MPDWSALRRRANVQHKALRPYLPADAPLLPPAEMLLAAAEAASGVDRRGVPSDDSLLAGAHAVLDRDFPGIWYAVGPDTSKARQRFAQAHEFAHFWLHPEVGEDQCLAQDTPEAFAPPSFRLNASQVVEGYSSKERRESEANLFAAELLLPAPILRHLFLEQHWNASRIATHTGLSRACVLSQLTSALLLPTDFKKDAGSYQEIASSETTSLENPSFETTSLEFTSQEDISATISKTESLSSESISPSSIVSLLDASQRAAAHILKGPALVDAGPGTGKTRTLIARILFLLTERHVAPENILALTFSNKAAEEMNTRLRTAVGDHADRVWIGTFHAFGRELLRKEGGQLGLPLAPELIDLPDAVMLLEQNIDRLNLRHFEYLNQPILPFPDILDCISRAKDELVTPAQFAALAQKQLAAAASYLLEVKQWEAEQSQSEQQSGNSARNSAANDKNNKKPKSTTKKELRERLEEAERLRILGEKWQEVAQVYEVYQELLRQEHKLDFGDLLMRSVELLDSFPNVRERWQLQYPHILADEYQDINRASAQLVQRLAGSGEGLWAVGDLRQAIYRFRGASPANVRKFDIDFPGAKRLPLERNYRSVSPLVAMFGAYAGGMEGTSATFSDWQPHRIDRNDSQAKKKNTQESDQENKDNSEESVQSDTMPAITLAVADDEETQADGIAEEIRNWVERGVPLREQVILCYTHQQASRLSTRLGARGIETQHLSGLFEHAVVKDLLALLSLVCEPEGTALRRVARFAEYAIPEADVQLLLHTAREQNIAFPRALMLSKTLVELSEAGRAGLLQLDAHWRAMQQHRSAWALLTCYLFETSGYLRPLTADPSVAARQKLLAINELLAVALRLQKRFESEENPPLAFLNYLRYLLACRQEKTLRLAGDEGELGGVRLMTIHRSKGLEFPVVYLPNLVKDQFPTGKIGKMVIPPGIWTDPLPADESLDAENLDSEESEGKEAESLFFVALSRARDALVLSRPLIWNGKPIEPCALLTEAAEALATSHVRKVYWTQTVNDVVSFSNDDSGSTHFDATASDSTDSDSTDSAEMDAVNVEIGNSESAKAQEPLIISASAAEQYRDCPRRYYYTKVLQLPMRKDKTPYLACRSGWQDTLNWLQSEQGAGREPSLEEARHHMRMEWNKVSADLAGAQGRVLRERAMEWLDVAYSEVRQTQRIAQTLELEAKLEHGSIRVPVDHAEQTAEDGLRLVDFKTRRNDKEDHKDIRLALARHAAYQQKPERPVRIVLEYLGDGTQREVEATRYEPERVKKYDAALKGIQEGRFEPNPNPTRCAECPFFLVCPE